MICLSLTAPTFAHMSSDIEHYAGYIDLVELRADLLDCASALESGAAKAREFAHTIIFLLVPLFMAEEKIQD